MTERFTKFSRRVFSCGRLDAQNYWFEILFESHMVMCIPQGKIRFHIDFTLTHMIYGRHTKKNASLATDVDSNCQETFLAPNHCHYDLLLHQNMQEIQLFVAGLWSSDGELQGSKIGAQVS